MCIFWPDEVCVKKNKFNRQFFFFNIFNRHNLSMPQKLPFGLKCAAKI